MASGSPRPRTPSPREPKGATTKVRTRLVLAFSYILLTVIVALTVPLAVNLRGRAVAELKTQVLVSVQTMAASIGRENLVAGKALDRLVLSYATQVGGRVIVMDTRGEVLADSDGTAVGQNFADCPRPEIIAALGLVCGSGNVPTVRADGSLARVSPSATSTIRYSNTDHADLMAAAAPVFDEGLAGAVRVTKNVQSVSDAVRAVTIGLIVVGIGGLIAGLLIAFAIAGSLARPLTALAAAARRLGDGDLTARAGDVTGASEIEDLASSFDEMAGRLERTVLAQRAFVANASHQLRTPLTGMKLRLESALADSEDPEVRRQLEAADREVDRLAEIVSSLLVMARQAELGEPVDVDVDAVVARAVERWADRATGAGATVTVIGSGGSARADATGLDQILDNLLHNAIEYAPGPIEVEAGWDSDRVTLAVRDHGAGIPPEERARVTERFYRGARPRGAGSGLGLAIARELVERWGGSIEVADADREGTRVRIELPAASSLTVP